MDISLLTSPNPTFVGFLDTPLPETRKIPLMTKLFEMEYPKKENKHQIIIAAI
jgi:hypothetical protein